MSTAASPMSGASAAQRYALPALVAIALCAAGWLEFAAQRSARSAANKSVLLTSLRNGGADPSQTLQRAIAESGLAEQVRPSAAPSPDVLRVRIESAPFETVLTLLARLEEREGVRPGAARLEASAESGRVDATLDFPLTAR